MNNRGYFSIGIYRPKKAVNVGGIFRSAHCFGANHIFTIDGTYRREASDTTNAAASLPLFEYKSFNDFYNNKPKKCVLIGVELDSRAKPIKSFCHPSCCSYLVGSEAAGLPEHIREKCDILVQIESRFCLNVCTAASIVLFDRNNKT